jgi:hypothetical protein
MDSCEEDVITECGIYLLAEEDGNTRITKCFERGKRKENFTLCLGV